MIEGLKILYSSYPRQFAMPNRFRINSITELIENIDAYNGKTRCFCTLYNYIGNNDILLDKICFDFDNIEIIDGNPRCWHDSIKLHEYLMENNLLHCMIFSGKGFHFYIFAEYSGNSNKKEVLEAAQLELINKLQLEVDPTCVGDVARFFGIPGTLNLKHRRFVRFISSEELRGGYDKILDSAVNQRSTISLYGKKKMNLNNIKIINTNIDMESLQISDFTVKVDDALLKNAPPCIISALKINPIWKARWAFAIWAKERGWSPKMIDKIARKYYEGLARTDNLKNNYNHFKKVNVIHYVFERDDFFPTCEWMMSHGLCPGKCDKYPYHEKLYKKVRI